MKRKINNAVIFFLLAALCVISISFHVNHKRLKKEVIKLRSYNVSYFPPEDVALINKVLGESLKNSFFVNKVTLEGREFMFCDLITSGTVRYVENEIGHGPYDFSNITFKEGDVVIDIGGNVGMISIFLAKKFPFLKIYAFEPVKENFESFKKNVKLNKIPEGVITVENLAVTKDGRDVTMSVNLLNSGGSSVKEICHKTLANLSFEIAKIPSITLDDIFKKYNISSCKLLKIDCEGSEYEILYNTDKNTLKKSKHLRGEFHENSNTRKMGYSANNLKKYCDKIFDEVVVETNKGN